MDEDARMKELDYTGLRSLQFVAGLRDPSLREVRLRMLHRLDTHSEKMPLTSEDLVTECENITALKMGSTAMGECQDIRAVQNRKAKCYSCGGPHYRSTYPLLPSKTDFLLDSPDITLISRRTWKRLGSPDLEPRALPLKTAVHDREHNTRKWVVLRHQKREFARIGVVYPAFPADQQLKEKYHCTLVAEGKSKRAELKMKLKTDLKKQFAEIFKCELGRCTKTKAKLVLKDDAIPVFKKKPPVPHASVTDLDKEIDR
ncbi:hypothetical protein OESDEN_22821 [Oesophagostomum dentatum]|uniref:Uncharacterized protein n=1 Tax=Oesophagostomum dentatum TaxID=61180 RepID=A0A0B1RY08_OESDE|nr:hypothetical protein OESDEN_22821 [Oesophagostomum dentatum]